MFWTIAFITAVISLVIGYFTHGATSHFGWYLASLILFSMAYWFTPIHLVIALPAFLSIALAKLGESLNPIFRVPIFVVAHIFGTTWLAFLWGSGIAFITLYFSGPTGHPWIYMILGAVAALAIAAPTGETNIFGILESLGSYLFWFLLG